MKDYTYLIVGGGLAADAAVRGIREKDPNRSIALFTEESDPPYTRPALSKKLWQGKPIEKIWRKTADLGAEIFLKTKIELIRPETHEIITAKKDTFRFEKLLIATGGRPRTLPNSTSSIIYFRDLGDYRKLRMIADTKDKFIIIGGGFIGSEITAALANNQKKVTMIFPEFGISQRIFPSSVSDQINRIFETHGVEVLSQTNILQIEDSERVSTVIAKKSDGTEIKIQSDAIVAGIGLLPNVELAEQAELDVDNGIKVNEFLQTKHNDIYSAGDVTNYFDFTLRINRRIEHEDNSVMMGLTAGHNMAGSNEKYTHLPYFYSDMFDIGYEAVGDLDSRLDIFINWISPLQKGIFYYRKEGVVRGILLWNIWGKLEVARSIISQGKMFNEKELSGLITL